MRIHTLCGYNVAGEEAVPVGLNPDGGKVQLLLRLRHEVPGQAHQGPGAARTRERKKNVSVSGSVADLWNFDIDSDPDLRILWLMDPHSDPAIFVSDLQDINNKKIFQDKKS